MYKLSLCKIRAEMKFPPLHESVRSDLKGEMRINEHECMERDKIALYFQIKNAVITINNIH